MNLLKDNNTPPQAEGFDCITGKGWITTAIVALLTTGLVSLHAQFGGFGGGLGNQQTRQYQNATQVGEALIEVDPETRSVIVITDEDTNLQIDQVLKTLDRPKPQVLIKVVFMEVTHRDDLDVGMEGAWNKVSGSTTNIVQSAFGLATPGQGGLYQLLDSDFNVTLRAISEAGKVEVLSRPSILARNNQEAIITVGQTVPFIDNVNFLQGGQQVNTVTYRDIGIILRVTPFITQDGMVEMIVAPEISTITDERVTISDGVEAPVFAKRAAETVVVTPHGRTVIIGGLMEKNKIESKRKVPILGDIPILGWAFSRKVKEDTKTELLIFLTPYIVQDPRQLGEMTALESKNSQLPSKAFTEEELDQFVGDVEGLKKEEDIENDKKKKGGLFRKNK
ncbi:MAG: type II secretion system protein GspD [Verrucomicrobiota bacterium]|jgi:general secretion pathway protein D